MRSSITLRTLLLASDKGLTALSALLATAALTRLLSKGDYATFKQVMLLYAIASPLLMMGVPKALLYFIPGETERPRGVLLDNLLLLACGAAVFGAALLLGLDGLVARRFDNPAVLTHAWLLVPYALCMFPTSALGPALVALDRVRGLVLFNALSRALLLAAVVGAAWYWRAPGPALTAQMGWAAAVVGPAMWMMWRALGRAKGRAHVRTAWKQLSFAVPLGLASLLGTLSLQLDKFVVSSMCTTEQFAVYVTGAMQLPLIGVVTGALMAAVLPDMTLLHKSGNPRGIVRLWRAVMEKALLLLAPAMGLTLAFGPEIARFLFGPEYEASARPLRIYALMLPLRGAVYGSVLMATDNTRQVTVAALLGLTLNAALSVVLVAWMGADGAAWATVLSTYGVVVYMLRPISSAVQTPYLALVPWGAVVRTSVVALLPAPLFWWLAARVRWLDVAELLVFGGLYGVTVLLAYRVTGLATPRDLWASLRKRGGDHEE